MIRPRYGDFCYTEYEHEIMCRQVENFKNEGADAVVIGSLNIDGTLNEKQMKELIKEAGQCKITLHRAFDMCKDYFQTMEEAIKLGVDTILTSGGKQNCIVGAETIRNLVEQAEGRIEILVGAGVSQNNIAELIKRTKTKSYSVTVAPYMGEDSVTPFLTYEGKWVILLALTSNKGSHDFQLTEDANGERLFEKVLRKSQEWANDERMMYVVGATQGRAFEDIRKIVPNHFLLVPGVGAQGGSLEEVCKYGMNSTCGLIVNSSRGIIYVDKTEKFAEAARLAAQEVQVQMAEQLKAIL